jgi:hypothetical protein
MIDQAQLPNLHVQGSWNWSVIVSEALQALEK